MSWKSQFQPQILSRGLDYYQQNLVTDFEQSGRTSMAIVFGSEAYEVRVRWDGERIEAAACNCPYAADGNYCKHMAALCFYVDESEESTQPELQDKASVASLVATASDTQVRDFLSEVLVTNDRLMTRFKTQVLHLVASGGIETYQQQIAAIITNRMDRTGFIDYQAAPILEDELAAFIDDDLSVVIDDGQLKLAFDIVAYIVQQLTMLSIDDSNGETMRLIESCADCWERIVDLADITLNLKTAIL